MIKNFLKTTLRVLYRNKGFTFINILGLSLGVTCCILIALYVNHEASFDKFHKNSKRIVRLYIKAHRSGVESERFPITSPRMGEDLAVAIPEIEKFLRIGGGSGDLRYSEKSIPSGTLLYADSTLWDFFDYRLIQGNRKQALAEPFSLVLNENLAQSLFGEENPIGKTVTMNGNLTFTVTGVVENKPSNTRLNYNGFISFTSLYRMKGGTMTEWDGNFSFQTLFLLTQGANIDEVTNKANDVADEALNIKLAQINIRYEMALQNLRDIHLYTNLKYEKPGVARVLYITSAIGLFILFIAGFNFVNLTTARGTRRAKEVGMRLAVGSSKSQIRWQFIGESILLSLISTLIGLLIVELVIPWYNNFLELNLSLYHSDSLYILFSIPFFVVAFGLLAGLYPAYFLSSFNPIRVIKADFGGVRSKPVIRNILVTLQFVVSSLLIIVTIIIFLQIKYLKNKDLGLDTRDLIVATVKGDNMWQRAQRLKEAMLSIPEVEIVGISTEVPGTDFTQNGYSAEGVEDPVMIRSLGIDYDFLRTLGASLAEGRNLSQQFPSDQQAVVINQALVKKLGWENPIGKKIIREKEFIVVGVINDFHYKSLHSEIEPLIMFLTFDYFHNWSPKIHVRLREGATAEGIEKLKNVWVNLEPNADFKYDFVQDIFNRQYKAEDSFSKLFIYFSILAVFISCLGLLGLSSYMLENRKREIGVRKVLGSGIGSLMAKFSIDFTRWAILGTLIAWPIAWYSIREMLNSYAYRIEIPWLVFLLAAAITFAVSLSTIILQTYKAAKTNPVDTLKYE